MFKFLLRLLGLSSKPKRQPSYPSEEGPSNRPPPGHKPPGAPSYRLPVPAPAPVPSHLQPGQILKGKCHVIDGDTIVIKGAHIRLAGIDAPELNDPYGKVAKFAMIKLCKDQVITATISEGLTYDRIVAKCSLSDGTDLSAALVKQGLALDWAKFSRGDYRHLEPADVRKKLWRVDAKHKGRLKMAAK
ncbi:thermonuclease family protein [Falsirhodobacter sp. 20TX0035]|uniref:thermonuclease family protein n=1 Tax=Falsirhodobacter sp. 20TX0035 TaxID=3022019 RepID=UPI00232AE15D|nr:thermonuclease family protein [Falsirhodobacter sp. 20TX0035]MDB6454452.1 thermonuclease family protein [Falsirhodobacter sp. 20TX0035]